MKRPVVLLTLAAVACGGPEGPVADTSEDARSLKIAINEVSAGRSGFVELLNGSDHTAQLTNWAIDDNEGGSAPRRFSLTLAPGALEVIDYGGVSGTSQENYRLLDGSDNLVDEVGNMYDPVAPNPQSVTGRCFRRMFYPWQANRPDGMIEGACTPGEINTAIRAGDVIINELAPGPHGFVEVMNTSGHHLTFDDLIALRFDDGPGRSRPNLGNFPQDGLDDGAVVAVNYTGISGTSRETLYLTSTEGVVFDQHDNYWSTGHGGNGNCYGRLADRSWAPSNIACTPGAPNGGGASSGNIVINEYQAGSGGFIELFNVGTTRVDLGGWSVDDVANGGSAPRTISGVVLEAGAWAVINYSGINRASADEVRVIDASGRQIDQRRVPGGGGDSCFGRHPDGGAWSDNALPTCTPGQANDEGVPAPACSARGGSYAGVTFTADQECRALDFMNHARMSELVTMGVVPAETAYYCDASGCGTYRGRAWTSLADWDVTNFDGGTPGPVAFTALRSASAAWVDDGLHEDTVANTWTHRSTTDSRQIVLPRAYVERVQSGWVDDDVRTHCVIIRDEPNATNYLEMCEYQTSCHDGTCRLPAPPDVRTLVGTYIWVQGHYESGQVDNLIIQSPR